MLPERTTTIGEGESEMTERPFHICWAGALAGSSEGAGRRLDAHHEGGREDQTKVEQLGSQLPRVSEAGRQHGSWKLDVFFRVMLSSET